MSDPTPVDRPPEPAPAKPPTVIRPPRLPSPSDPLAVVRRPESDPEVWVAIAAELAE